MYPKTYWAYPVLAVLLILAGCRKDGSIKTGKSSPVIPTTLSISSVLQSNMVVQRDKPVTIWGQAPVNTVVTVTVSWNNAPLTDTADAVGNWKVSGPAAPANAAPQSIMVQAIGFSQISLDNILIGDVWICSGQSNMVMPVDLISPFRGVLNYQTEIATGNYPMIRTMTLQEDHQLSPLSYLSKTSSWHVCSTENVGSTSAVAYYFARKLNTTLNVPVGIIISAVNSTLCQDWTDIESIAGNPQLSNKYLAGSSSLYNGMISPLTNLTIKGFAWYQGEKNESDVPVSGYTLLNAALINGWRTKFKQGDLPFYFVQLTPFADDYYDTNPPGGNARRDFMSFFREAQANIRQAASGTGMAVTMDVGDQSNDHPRDKEPVGERLALLALNYTYGQNVQCLGPQYNSFTANQYKVTVNFIEGTADGLATSNSSPLNQYFFVAGPDHVFRLGRAVILGNSVVITAPAATPLPIKSVRYAFTDAPISNLQNSAGLPAEPFRTDTWDN